MTRMELATAILLAVILLAGCSKDEPVPFITTEAPALPAECVAPATPEPKLPGQGKRDVMVDEAARDRAALRSAYRSERILRSACKQRLEVLFPQKKL